MLINDYAYTLRENRLTNLAAKVVVWAATATWVMGLLSFAMMLLPTFTGFLDSEGIEDHIYKSLLILWYIATVVLIGIGSTYFAFKRVAWWEIEEDEDESE